MCYILFSFFNSITQRKISTQKKISENIFFVFFFCVIGNFSSFYSSFGVLFIFFFFDLIFFSLGFFFYYFILLLRSSLNFNLHFEYKCDFWQNNNLYYFCIVDVVFLFIRHLVYMSIIDRTLIVGFTLNSHIQFFFLCVCF